MNRRTFLGAAVASLVAAACSPAPKAVSTTAPATPSPTPGPPATKATVERVKGGSFSFTLRADKAPQTVARFSQKARAGFYDNLTFHRVEDWVVRGGEPLGNATGGEKVLSEYNDLTFAIEAPGIAG